jgi:hypothetical protein
MCSITGRYTGSPESDLEFDLARLRTVADADGFVRMLDGICEAALPNDFWTITLPNDLATSSPRSPSLFAYYAALVLDGATALFSDQKVEKLLDPSVHSHRAATERHHLFPRAYLKTLGITEIRDVNQIANYALVEWSDNGDIGKEAPADYLPRMRTCVPSAELVRQYRWHALPDGWETMPYEPFLGGRRERIARFVAETYQQLRAPAMAQGHHADLESLIRSGEGSGVEFKSTLRVNLHTGQPDPRMELACLKTIAGFLNSTSGGTLVVGLTDDGEVTGLDRDQFPNEDKMSLHLIHLVRDRIGPNALIYVHPRFEDRDTQRILAVQCWPAKSPAFVKDGQIERFYVRTGPSTTELSSSQAQEYIKQRF